MRPLSRRSPAAALWLLAVVILAFGFAVAVSAALPTPAFAQDGSGDDGGGETNLLVWIWNALGFIYTPTFLLLSFIGVALFVMNLLSARRSAICPLYLVEAFEGHLNEKRYQEAYELAKTDDSVLGHVLSRGLAKLSAGYQQAIEAMQEAGEEENMKLEHRLSYMALLGSIAPMVGLFGTVHGMIMSFMEIAKGGNPQAEDLAMGISTALFTTLLGLFIAIPAIVAYNILRNFVSRRVLEVGMFSEDLMSRFQNVGAQPKKA